MQQPVPGATTVGGLVGRDHAFTVIAAALADVRSSQRRVIVIDADAGFGKTSLLHAALDPEDATVLWANGDELEHEVDHGIIEQLTRSAPMSPDRIAVPLSGDPLHTGAAIVRLVDDLALDPRRPLVVVVDDAQWADLPSLRALTFAARRLRRDPVALLVAIRTEGVGNLPKSLLHLAGHEGAHLHLGALGRDDVRTMAEDCLDTKISTRAADRLLVHTQGSPLHLRTLLADLRPESLDAEGELPSPRSYSTLVLARLASCGEDVEALVAAVAVLGERVPVAVAAQVARIADPLPVLDEAVTQDLLRVVAEREGAGPGVHVAPAHPLVGAAVLNDLPAGRRASLHRQAGAVLEGTAGLRHRLRGVVGSDPALWRDGLAAARAEASRGAHGAAAELSRLSAGAAPDAASESQSLLEAIEQLLLAGRLAEAQSIWPAVQAAPPSARRSYVEGRLAYAGGPRRAAPALLDDAWRRLMGPAAVEPGEDVDLLDPAEGGRQLAGRVAAALATVHVDRGMGEPAVEWARRALDLAPAQAALDSAAHMLAGAYALTGRLEEGREQLDALCAGIGGGSDADPLRADAHSGRGLLCLWSHDLERAADDLELALAAAMRAGSFAARESARFYLAQVRYRQGRWDEAIQLGQMAASIVDDSDQGWLAALPHATVARPLAARGDPEAEDHVRLAMEAATAVGTGVGLGLARVSALEVATCRRDAATAVEVGRLIHGAGGIDDRIAPWRAAYVDALVATGDLPTAAEIANELEAASTTPLTACHAAIAAVLVSSALRDHQAVDDAARRGLALDADLVGSYPRARLELEVGRDLRRRGERRRAQRLLEQARARFAALAAAPWLEQVDREIQALGLRPARRSAPPGTDLTPQERTVAQLVAEGRTNREVAAELVVSAKTIEHHLSRIYAKVGVRSRTELAHRLREET